MDAWRCNRWREENSRQSIDEKLQAEGIVDRLHAESQRVADEEVASMQRCGMYRIVGGSLAVRWREETRSAENTI
jgi:hypothetical protein